MTIYEIINAANEVLNIKNASLILHKNIQMHPKIKVYKIFNYNLYLVGKDTKCVLSLSDTKNVPSSELNNAWEEMDIAFCKELLNWLTTDDFKQLKNGIQ